MKITDNPGGRFRSLQIVTRDHGILCVICNGALDLTQETVGTRHVSLAFETLVQPSDPEGTAIDGDSGIVTIQFDGCGSALVECNLVTNTWSRSFRAHQQKPEVLNEAWQFADVMPVAASGAAEAP
ncbi:MAG: hypothetical protein NXH97_18910 [Rhodobacteraceae bacterium]|nr:hypothetical protein [Paracoccaceae bacterium]